MMILKDFGIPSVEEKGRKGYSYTPYLIYKAVSGASV